MQSTHMRRKGRVNKTWGLFHVYLFVKKAIEEGIIDVARQNPHGVGLAIFLCYVWFDLVGFVGSRHLVFNWGLLGNLGVLVLSEIRG